MELEVSRWHFINVGLSETDLFRNIFISPFYLHTILIQCGSVILPEERLGFNTYTMLKSTVFQSQCTRHKIKQSLHHSIDIHLNNLTIATAQSPLSSTVIELAKFIRPEHRTCDAYQNHEIHEPQGFRLEYLLQPRKVNN